MFVQWNPWRELNRLERDLGWLANPAQLRRNAQAATEADNTPPIAWQPAVDIHEDDDKILLVADLPGVDREEIDISVDKNILTLKGERKAPAREGEKPDEKYKRIERVHGRFARAFTLPQAVESDKVAAELKNGVLTLTLPKRAAAQPSKIKVNVA